MIRALVIAVLAATLGLATQADAQTARSSGGQAAERQAGSSAGSPRRQTRQTGTRPRQQRTDRSRRDGRYNFSGRYPDWAARAFESIDSR